MKKAVIFDLDGLLVDSEIVSYKLPLIVKEGLDLVASREKEYNYRDFQAKLMPTVDKETIIGVRTPSLRAYAKKVQ